MVADITAMMSNVRLSRLPLLCSRTVALAADLQNQISMN